LWRVVPKTKSIGLAKITMGLFRDNEQGDQIGRNFCILD
jgi:hypothetical protein